MADPTTITGPTPDAPVVAVAAAAPSPVVVETPAAAPTVEAVATEPAPVVEAAAEPVVEPAAQPAEAAPVAAEPEAPAAETPAEPVTEPAAPEVVAPKYADFELADGVTIPPEKMSAFTDILGKHGIPQEAGQELLNIYQAETKKFLDDTAQHQQEVWAKTNAQWVKDAEKQFGNHYQTTVNDAKRAISDLFPDKKERTEIWTALAMTGAGNHPAVIRAFARAARKMGEGKAPAQSLPSNGAKSGPAWERRYGGR